MARKKQDGGPIVRPGDGADGPGAGGGGVGREGVDEAAPEPLSPMVGLDRDEVEHGLVRPVRADEPEQEAHAAADPRPRPGATCPRSGGTTPVRRACQTRRPPNQ